MHSLIKMTSVAILIGFCLSFAASTEGIKVKTVMQRADCVLVEFDYVPGNICSTSPNTYWNCHFIIPGTDQQQKQKLAILMAAFQNSTPLVLEWADNACLNYGGFNLTPIVTIGLKQ